MISENQQQPLHQHQHRQHLADLESIPNQIGHAILNSSDGSLLSSSGTLSQNDVDILYQVVLEIGETMKPQKNGFGGGFGSTSTSTSGSTSVEGTNGSSGGGGGGEKLKKITIEGGGIQYSICVTADGFIYLIKRRSVDQTTFY